MRRRSLVRTRWQKKIAPGTRLTVTRRGIGVSTKVPGTPYSISSRRGVTRRRTTVGCLLPLLLVFLSILACGESERLQPRVTVPRATAGSTPKLTIVSAVQGVSASGKTQVVFQVRNDGTIQARFVKVRGDCYKGGVVVATDWTYSSPEHLNPGQTGTNRIWFDEGVTCDRIQVYSVTTD